MKKIKIILFLLVVAITMVGCESSTAKKAVEQGKLAMASKEYDKALGSFKLAIDEGSKNEEIKIISSIIDTYNQANREFESNNIEESKKIIDGINENYVQYSIKDDVDSLNKKIDEKLIMQDEINSSIEAVKELVINKDYNDAKKVIEELSKKELGENNKKEIEELNNTIESELEKIEANKKLTEQEQIKKDYENGENWKHGGGVKADEFYEPTQEQIQQDYEDGNNWLHGGGVKADE